MEDFLNRAQEINQETVDNRRWIHQNAESGLVLPKTTEFVKNYLEKIGLEPELIIESGVTANIVGGKKGKTILLRADMDALPMEENNDLPFKSITNDAHTCGHDMHTAMLLAAARLLKERQSELCGTVKLMFQPAEECFKGSMSMIEAGILENPKVDAAMAIHVMLDGPAGGICFCSGGMTSSCDGFKITIQGKASHGAMPHLGINPINVGLHIYQAFQGLISREVPPLVPAVLTIGQFSAGVNNNIIPDKAVLQGTLRTYDKELREKLNRRIREITTGTAQAMGASAEIEVLSAIPAAVIDAEMLSEMLGYTEHMGYDFYRLPNYKITPSDDFGFITERVPSVYFMLCAKTQGNSYPHHNPGVVFSEDVLPLGAAIHAQCAFNWLKNHS